MRTVTHIYKAAASIPLHSLGVVDIAGTAIQENELLSHALANVSTVDKSLGWAVKRSGDFVNEYPRQDADGNRFASSCENPNHLLGSFPCLFPYGLGGFEVDRPISVSYESHARWALRYHDKHFCKDHHFMFQIFGVLQKRKICAAANLQISKRAFLQHKREFLSLRPSDFENASVEENAHRAFSNPTMKSFRHHISSVRAKVMGTDESRIKIRPLIWGMCIMKNPPNIWLTINPADTQDPIAQVLCGEEFDLDTFDAGNQRPSDTAIATDPYAAASFFRVMIDTVLECLLGIKGYSHGAAVQREVGILGEIGAYIGTVEAQGRETLHLHMLLWLNDSLTSKQMKDHLLSADFRDKLKTFISKNVCADIPNVHGSDVFSLPRQTRVAFSHPIDPRKPNYFVNAREAEKKIARTVQLHRCGPACMRLVKDRFRCKRRAPFPLADEDWVNDEGEWGPRRTNGYLNNWCPSILQCTRSNHDIKLMSNAREMKHVGWYITLYLTKKQAESSNISALLVKSLAFHQGDRPSSTTISDLNKKLVQQCANTLSREQELSTPEVISYLMGWEDRFISHHFETIHWYNVVKLLKQTFIELNENW